MSDDVKRALKGGRLFFLVAILVGALLLGARMVSGLYIDVLWFEAAGFLSVFWTRTFWRWGLRLLAGGVTAAFVYFNLRYVASTLGAIQIKRKVGDLEISEKLPRSYVTWAVAGLALLVAFWFAAAVPGNAGIRTLLLLNVPEWGLADPILGRDASFYVFALPILSGTLTFGMVLVFLTAALTGAGYSATGSVGWTDEGPVMNDTARVHLSVLLGLFLLFLAGRFWLGRYGLLLSGNSGVQGIFGYADAEARLTGYAAMAILTVGAAAGVVWSGIRNRALPLMASLGGVVLAGIGLLQLYPSLVQRFQVEPNELARESPYIEHNLDFTRRGFGLHELERRPFDYTRTDDLPWDEAARQISGFPVWSDGALLTTYREVEARFRYYAFPNVAVDRYPAESGMEPISISVREIDPAGIQDPNWQNLHLRRRYISGMGAVASAAARKTPEGRPAMLLSGIPPELAEEEYAPDALRIDRSAVYFGSRPQLYAVLNPGEGIMEGPGGEAREAGVDYPRGIRMSSLLRTLALAWRFRDANVLFASEVSEASRFVFRRQVQERVRTVAPFLDYLEDPYPVVAGGRIVWVMEAFTATRGFPLSSAHQTGGRRSVNYIRNSVKVTVDAVSGETRFYVVEEDDPLIQAYRGAFPDLFQPLEEMPGAIREHIRYPRSLLDLQAGVLRQYHQDTPARFHGQQDVWDRPQELGAGSRSVPYATEYGYYRLPGEEEPGFHLSTVFVPAGRQNLTGIMVARSDPERYGELLLLDVAIEDQVSGPRQVEALVEQDPTISEQFSLWRTGGSQVWTGHLHLVPVGNSLLYMEPIYLAAEADAIPELRRFILSDGNRVVMADTKEDALNLLREGGSVQVVEPEGRVEEAATAPAERRALPERALELLQQAEERLRSGDWAGYGRALDELRSLLEGAAEGPGGASSDPPPGGSDVP